MLEIYTDGASRGNPGKSAWAFVCSDGHFDSGYMGRATNNEAEYTAIINALKYSDGKKVKIFSDSNLIVQQLKGKWQVLKMKKLFDIANNLSKNAEFIWVPRKDNFYADKLCNLVLDRY